MEPLDIFHWKKGMDAIQDIQIIYGEISDDTWEEMVLVVRRTLHGIGETSKKGRTFGWQQ